LGPVSQLVDT